MFDKILNATLRRFPPLGLHKGNLKLPPCLLILLIRAKHKAIRWYQGNFIDLAEKAKNVWLIVGRIPKKDGWWDAPLALRDFSRSNKYYGNAMSCLWPGGLQIKLCCGHKEACYIATHQREKFQQALNKTLLHNTISPQQLKHSILER